MEEKDYYELFGLDEGENEQEVAEPAAEVRDNGEKDQDVTEPESFDDDASSEGADIEDAHDGKKVEQSAEERRRNAAERRKKETDDAIANALDGAKKEHDSELLEALATAGIKNPATGKAYESADEYRASKEELTKQSRRAMARRAGMSDDEFEEFISKVPEVAEARKAKETAAADRAKSDLDKQIAEVTAIDPSIKSLTDLAKIDNYEQFYDLVKKGVSFADAYRLANFDKIKSGTAERARQAEVSKLNGKDHLTRTSSRGTGADSVPREVYEQYKLFCPDATDAEIRAHYNKSRKG